MYPTILATLPAGLLEATDALGFDAPHLAATAGLPPELLRDPDARVPLPAYLALWAALSTRTDGLALGAHLGVRGLDGIGFALRYAPTVGEALAWLHRYSHVVHPNLGLVPERRTTPAGDEVVFTHAVPAPLRALRAPVLAYAASLHATLERLSGHPAPVRTVALPLSRGSEDEAAARFFGHAVIWDQPAIALAYPAEVLARPIAGADPRLYRYFSQRADALAQALPAPPTFAAHVRDEIEARLAQGEPRLSSIARALAVSERTLHRHLAREGARFADLVETARQVRAHALLADARLSTAEVAFLLGYADATAFARAFRRWTGQSPRAYRLGRSVATGSTISSSEMPPCCIESR